MPLIYKPFIKNSGCHNHVLNSIWETLCRQLQESKEKSNELNVSFNQNLDRFLNNFLNYHPAHAVISLLLTKEETRGFNMVWKHQLKKIGITVIISHSLESVCGRRTPCLKSLTPLLLSSKYSNYSVFFEVRTEKAMAPEVTAKIKKVISCSRILFQWTLLKVP